MNSVLKRNVVEYPFPGLRPFQEGEEHLFFGRESQTDAMIDKLAATRFLAVIGSSGSGKSSLVNCGLCLGLHGGLMPNAGTAWKIASCRPGDNPIGSMANALAAEGVLFSDFENSGMSLASIIETNLRTSKLGIIDAFEQSRQSDETNLLIIVDQFEELFRFQKSTGNAVGLAQQKHDEAVAFVKLLLMASTQPAKRVYIVLTMRSDFLGECTRIEGLTEAINSGQFLVPRMTREQRRLAISGPIAVAGARIDDTLLTRLVNDLGNNHDQLSILQHALNRIWAHWGKHNDSDEPLSLKNYAAIGSMKHALDRHAEKAFDDLTSPREKQLAEKLFRALTDKSSHAEGIRRPTSLDTLCKLTDATADELIRVINAFRKPSRSFLMPPIDEEIEPQTMVDISHESLMRMWKRLIRWADKEASSEQTYRRLATTAQLYEQERAGLWRDPDLQLALEWRHHNEPNAAWASRIAPGFDKSMQFLDDSRAKSDEEKAEQLQAAEQHRELEHARAIADEQEQRIHVQNMAAKRQKLYLGSIIATLVAVLALGVLSSKRGTALEKQETELKGEKLLAGGLLYTHQYSVSARALLESTIRFQQKSSTGATDATQTRQLFHNRSSHEYELFKLSKLWKLDKDGEIEELSSPQGIEPAPKTVDEETTLYGWRVPAGQSYTLKGHANQIWIARSLTDLTVTATGVMQLNAEAVELR